MIFEDERIKALNIAQKNYKMAILDDGLQQKNIKYDLKIVCFNSTEAIGNNFILPAGPLREKFSEIKTYDLVFIIGDNPDRKFINKIKTIKKNSNIFFANYSVSNLSKFNLKKKYLIFSGIGNPHEFENTLLKSKFKIDKKIIFPDHYNYNEKDLKMIKDLAKRKKLDIITTEKIFLDWINNKKDIKYLSIELKIRNIDKFKKDYSNIMKIIIYFIEYIVVKILFFIFKIIGYKNSSNLGFLIGKYFGPFLDRNL